MNPLGVLRTDSVATWPSAAAPVSATSGASWVYGTWVQVAAAASTSVPHLILGVFELNGSMGQFSDAQVGIGAAASETVLALTVGVSNALVPPAGSFPVWPSGARLAIRCRDNAGATAHTYWVVTCPLPSANAL